MTNKSKRNNRTLAAKLNISYQAADNIRKAGRRNGSAGVAVPADVEDGRDAQPAEEHVASAPSLVSQGALSGSLANQPKVDHVRGGSLSRARVVRHSYADVATHVAGWMALMPSSNLRLLLEATAEGTTTEEIERDLTRTLDRKQQISLRESRLPRSGAKNVEAVAATARLVGLDPPKTFGDLLRLLIRLGVVKEQAQRYSVAFPPPAPEETLPLTPEQRSEVLRWRNWLGGIQHLDEAIHLEGPEFVPPAWMSARLDPTRINRDEDLSSAYRPPGTRIHLEDVVADPALCDIIQGAFSQYFTEDPRECPCGAAIIHVHRMATTNADRILIEASCARGHFGYMGKLVKEVCSLDPSSEASVDLFLLGRPESESVQERTFYADYVVWSLAQRSRPVLGVTFTHRVMSLGLYRRTEARPGGRIYHRVPATNVV
jgi:hypothetical protein